MLQATSGTSLAALSACVVLTHEEGQGRPDDAELARLRSLVFQRVTEASTACLHVYSDERE